MNQREALTLERHIGFLLDDEIGFLKAQASEHNPDWWGVTIKLTTHADWLVLADAAVRYRQKYPAAHKRQKAQERSTPTLPPGRPR